MNGNNEETLQPVFTIDMKTQMLHFLLKSGPVVVALAVWIFTLYTDKQDLQKQLNQLAVSSQEQNERIITVLTKIEQYMDEAKYNNRIQEIRNK